MCRLLASAAGSMQRMPAATLSRLLPRTAPSRRPQVAADREIEAQLSQHEDLGAC